MKTWLFALGQFAGMTAVYITSEEVLIADQRQDDTTPGDVRDALPDCLCEEMENVFSFNETEDVVRQKMTEAGFIESEGFTKYVKQFEFEE